MANRTKSSFFRTLFAFIPTVNAVLIAVQAALLQPPNDTLLSPWIYVLVNSAVIFAAAAAKITWILRANPTFSKWLSPNATTAVSEHGTPDGDDKL
ncbi:hypothetical protein [Cryobacterium melibiosiphilum]|uniref:hypothetical protein n=1 Tax=Cryobacterium melibiosiphilum TaxID=995039 RepID=UPI0011C21132|nr:hypothetical protein [Cryobacterium melibiosiphilum]